MCSREGLRAYTTKAGGGSDALSAAPINLLVEVDDCTGHHSGFLACKEDAGARDLCGFQQSAHGTAASAFSFQPSAAP